MRIKSYFTNTVESAVSMARVELGSEALLISVRRTGPETKEFGAYEVVFGLAATEPAPAQAQGPELPPVVEKPTPLRAVSTGERSMERQTLLDADVSQALADEVIASLEQRVGSKPGNRNEIHNALSAEIEARFDIFHGPLSDPAKPCIAALIGPHGAGKTTTLVKLAIIQGLAAGRPVEIVSLDTQRVGATETLRSYATVLNVGFYPLDNPALLPHAIEDLIDRNTLILVDTPGCGKDEASISGLVKALSRRQDLESHLVLPATMSARELRRSIDRFAIFRPASMLFTRIDETVGYGRILTEAARTKTPLSFFGTGPEIPEDLETVTKQALADRVLGRRREAAVSAA
jgi:flagellar biosynthesis GTPase FlhF